VESVAAVTDLDTVQLSIAEFKPDRSRETAARPADTLRLVARAAFAPAHSAATIMAERLGAIRHAEAPVSAVAASTAAAVTAAVVAVDMPGIYVPVAKNLREE
jgi:hypothetical protein